MSGAPEIERLLEAEAMYDTLATLGMAGETGFPIDRAVLAGSYDETAYRLSLLSLLGDPDMRGDDSIVAQLARLPLRLTGGLGVTEPEHPEVACLSDATLSRIPQDGH